MNFFIKSLRLYFSVDKFEEYIFEPNKINVITGDSGTGKTSILSIIDYCLMSARSNIPHDIQKKVVWFGISLEINYKKWFIARKSPRGGVSGEVYFSEEKFSNKLERNISVEDLKNKIDNILNIPKQFTYPLDLNSLNKNFEINYRDFLLFNALTESIIGVKDRYLDMDFFGNDNFDGKLKKILEIATGVNSIKGIKAEGSIEFIDDKLKKYNKEERKHERASEKYNNRLNKLYEKCIQEGFFSEGLIHENKINIIGDFINDLKVFMLSDDYLLEIEYLKEKKDEIDFEVNVIKKYRKEYEIYKNNLNKNSDSLAPVLYLKSILNEELLKNYSTGDFIFYLEESLKDIQKKSHELDIPNYVANDDFDILKQEQKQINKRLSEISEIKERISSLSNKSFVFGEINHEYNELKKINEINSKNNIDYESKDKLLKYYNDLKEIVVSDDIKKSAIDSLNESIQTNFDTVKSMINYKNYKTIFDIGEVQLRLLPDSDQFPFFIDNVGSKSNYMFLHLCLFLGFHKHFLTQKENFVPNFLFNDQPSIPYYYGGKRSSDDKSKLIDAFKLLNTFMENVLVKYNFQIILVEHAPKNYWEDNKLGYFHVVSEFIDGKALIPKEIFEK